MTFHITFTLSKRTYFAHVTEETMHGSHVWLLEVENGGTYLLTKEARGWHCAELSKDECRVIGQAIDEELQLH